MAKKKADETAVPEPLDEEEFPLRKRVGTQMCDRVVSPLPDYPGCIYVVTNVSGPQFVAFWKKTHEAPEGELERLNYLWDYQRRQHLVKEWHIKFVDKEHIDDDSGKSLPAVELAGFVINATMPAVIRAMNLPNLPGWWPKAASTATSGSETAAPTPAS